MREVGCFVYASWVGLVVGVVLFVPAFGVLLAAGAPPLAGVLTLFVALAAGSLGGVVAVRDRAADNRGAGGPLGCCVGLVVMAYSLGRVGGDAPSTAGGWVALAVGFAILAALGALAGRTAERAARFTLTLGDPASTD